MENLPVCNFRGCHSHCQPAEDGTIGIWCTLHARLQGKYLRNYKLLTNRIGLLDATELPKPNIISSSPDASLLRRWHALAREKWSLINKACLARIYHHLDFFNDGDKGHMAFVQVLKRQMQELEIVMEACDTHLYKLLTVEFSWLEEAAAQAELDAGDNHHGHDSPDEPTQQESSKEGGDKPVPTPRQITATQDSDADSDEESPDPYTIRQNNLVTSLTDLWTRLATRNGEEAETPAKIAHRADIVSNLFRQIIIRTPCLLVRARARKFKDVPTFLREGDLSVEELVKIQRKLKPGKGTSVSTMRNAVADAFREPLHDDAEEGKIEILGGWYYQKPSESPLCVEAWHFMYEFMQCRNCILSASRNFAEYMHFERLSTFGDRYRRWNRPVCPCSQDFNSKLARLGVYMCRDNGCQLRYIGETRRTSRLVKPPVEEIVNRASCYLKLDANDPASLPFIRALKNSPAFFVMARNATTLEYIDNISCPPSSIWVMRRRVARSIPALDNAAWSERVLDGDIIDRLNKASPELERRTTCFPDVYEVIVIDTEGAEPFNQYYQLLKASYEALVAAAEAGLHTPVDNPHNPYDHFLGKILTTLCLSLGYSSWEEASQAVINRAITNGELNQGDLERQIELEPKWGYRVPPGHAIDEDLLEGKGIGGPKKAKKKKKKRAIKPPVAGELS